MQPKVETFFPVDVFQSSFTVGCSELARGERVTELLEGRTEAISGEFDSEDVSRTLEAYALMERKPGKRLMGLLEERVEAISGEFDSDDVSQTLL